MRFTTIMGLAASAMLLVASVSTEAMARTKGYHWNKQGRTVKAFHKLKRARWETLAQYQVFGQLKRQLGTNYTQGKRAQQIKIRVTSAGREHRASNTREAGLYMERKVRFKWRLGQERGKSQMSLVYPLLKNPNKRDDPRPFLQEMYTR